MRQFFIFCLLSIFLTSCASTPKEPQVTLREYIEAHVTKNQTTKSEILALFGKPQSQSVMDYANANMPQMPYVNTADLMPYEMWTYTSVKQLANWSKPKGSIFPLLGALSFPTNIKTVVFNFNRDGKVTGWTVNENEF